MTGSEMGAATIVVVVVKKDEDGGGMKERERNRMSYIRNKKDDDGEWYDLALFFGSFHVRVVQLSFCDHHVLLGKSDDTFLFIHS